MSVTAPVTNISKNSLHDGPGVRTVVYFKGCTLSCKWCHNPETISGKAEILYIPSKCIHCGKCIDICPSHHKISGDSMLYIRKECKLCGKCVENCPSLALTMCGKEMTTDEVFDEIKKDLHYYEASGGGVTFSGGECLHYPEFVAETAQKCKNYGIHTAIETALNVPWENALKVIPYTDLVFADFKIADSDKHKQYTGSSNSLIIQNLQKLSREHNNVILRIPVIPKVNDSENDMEEFASIINTFESGIKEIELLKYNNLAESKYAFSGREYTRFADSGQTNEEMNALCAILGDKTKLKCYCI